MLPFPPLEPPPAHNSWALEAENEECQAPIAQRRSSSHRESHSDSKRYFESSIRRDDSHSSRPRSGFSHRIRNVPTRSSSRCYAPRNYETANVIRPAEERPSLSNGRNVDFLLHGKRYGKCRRYDSEVCAESQRSKRNKNEFYSDTPRWRRHRDSDEIDTGSKRYAHGRSPDSHVIRRKDRTYNGCIEKKIHTEASAENKTSRSSESAWIAKRELGVRSSGSPDDSEQEFMMSDRMLLDNSPFIHQDVDLTPVHNEALDKSGFCKSTLTDGIEAPVCKDLNFNESFSLEGLLVTSENISFNNVMIQPPIISTKLDDRKIGNVRSEDCKATYDVIKLTDRSVDDKKITKTAERSGYSKTVTTLSKEDSTTFIDVTNKFHLKSASVIRKEAQEDDAHRLGQRQRQIEFGKNTLGYERYCDLIPRQKRKRSDPQTPNPKQICSKRSWDGQIRKWRRLLHVYDPPIEEGEEMAEDFSHIHLKSNNTTENDNERSHEAEVTTNAGNLKAMMKDKSLDIYEDWMEP